MRLRHGIATAVDGWLQRYGWTRVPATCGHRLAGPRRRCNYAGSMAYFSILSFFQLLVLGVVLLQLLHG